MLIKKVDFKLKVIVKALDGKTTVEGKDKRGIIRYELVVAIGGAADIATGHMLTDFDKRSGGGFLRNTAMAATRVATGGCCRFCMTG